MLVLKVIDVISDIEQNLCDLTIIEKHVKLCEASYCICTYVCPVVATTQPSQIISREKVTLSFV